MKTFYNSLFPKTILFIILTCSYLPSNKLNADGGIIVDVDTATPGIQLSLSWPLGAGPFTVDVYWLPPTVTATTPGFNMYGVAVEFNDSPGILGVVHGATIFDPGGSGITLGTGVPIDHISGLPLIGPMPPMATASVGVSGTHGTGGMFTGTDGGVAMVDPSGFFYVTPISYPTACSPVLLHRITMFPAGAVGVSDIAPIGIFIGPLIPCPPGCMTPGGTIPPFPGGAGGFSFFDSLTPMGEPTCATGCLGYPPFLPICPMLAISPGTVTVTSVVAAELGTLKADVVNESAMLKWETFTETDNMGFEILNLQRISDDLPIEDWFPIDFVNGNGHSSSMIEYNYELEDLEEGTHYFKLKQINKDETFTYSNVVKVEMEYTNLFSIGNVYPNPVYDQAAIPIRLSNDQTVTIDLINFEGQRIDQIFQGTLSKDQNHKVDFQTHNLTSGLYFLHIIGQNFEQTNKIIVAN